jgi:hypothetical protein
MLELHDVPHLGKDQQKVILLGNIGDMVNVVKDPGRSGGCAGNANNHRQKMWTYMYVGCSAVTTSEWHHTRWL